MWDDITEKLLNACTELETKLKPGEVITLSNITNENGEHIQTPIVSDPAKGHDINKTLSEAMSSIEMMERKMDAGCVLKEHQNENEIVTDFQHACKLGLASAEGLENPNQVKTVFDGLANAFARYVEGDNYQNTVGSCVFEHLGPDSSPEMDHSLTFNLSVSFRLCCSLVNDIVANGQIQEEEDFEQHQVFPAPIGIDQHDERMDKITQQFAKVKDEHGIMDRIRLIAYLKDYIQIMHMYLATSRQMDDQFVRHLMNYSREIFLLADKIEKESLNYEYVNVKLKTRELIYGFDPLMNYSKMTSGYPKATVTVEKNYFYKWIRAMCEDVQNALKLATSNHLYTINELGWNFARKAPCLIPRSITALILSIKLTVPQTTIVVSPPLYGELTADDISVALKHIVIDDLYMFCNKPKMFNDKKFGGDKFTQWFQPLCLAIDRMLPSICETATRQIFTYLHAINRFQEISAQAKELDQHFMSFNKSRKKMKKNESMIYPFSNMMQLYTMLWTFTCAEKYLLLGFELELFTRREFQMVCWMLTYVIERKMEVVQTAVAWFIATDKKKMDRDQTTYQAYLSTLCTRGQVLLNYAYGIYIACSVEQSATDKKETGTSTMCPESRIFKKRFGQLCSSLGENPESLYDAFTKFEIDCSQKNLTETFEVSRLYAEQLPQETGIVWSLGSIVRKSSGELANRIATDKMLNLVKANIVATKLMNLPGKRMVVKVDPDASLPVMKLI